MSNRANTLRLFVKIAKLISYFLIYQFVFLTAGRICSYLAYIFCVGDVTFALFESEPSALMTQYATQGVAVGMFLSSLAMITHLLAFGYVKIPRGFLSEVKKRVLLLSVLFIGCMMPTFNILATWLGLENKLEDTFDYIMKNDLGVFTIAVLAPVLEELLFRGAVQGALMRFFKHPWAGILVASLLFGIIHLNPVQVFYATCLGVGFGWLYYRTGSLLPAILGHIINNSLAVIANLLYGSEMNGQTTGDAQVDASMVLGATVAMLVFAWAIDRIQPSVPQPLHDADEET